MTGIINPLQYILAQYKEKIEQSNNERLKVSSIIESCSGVKISQKEIELSDNVIFIKTHPAKRQIVFFKKPEILEALQKDGFSQIHEIK